MRSQFSIKLFDPRLTLTVFGVLTCMLVMAQPGNDSPYGYFKLGNTLENSTVRSNGLGNLNVALDDQETKTLNYMNPASYVYMDSQRVVFDVAATWTLAKISDQNASENVNKANFAYISLGFPVTKWWKAGFGLRPFTNLNYSVSHSSQSVLFSDTLTETNIFEGKGGVNRFFVGSAFKIYKGLSAGFNFSYLFGKVTKLHRLEFSTPGYFNTKIARNTDVGSAYLDFGIQYAANIKRSKLVIGVTGSPTWNLNTTGSVFAQTYTIGSTGTEIPRDTVVYNESGKANVKLPLMLGAGITYVIKDKVLIGVQFNQESWSQYRDVDGLADTNLTDSWRVSAGVEIRPGDLQRGFWNYFKKINYRLGGFFAQSPIISRGAQVPEYGITVGMGFPVRHRSTSGPLVTSMINIAAEFGQRGDSNLNQLTEQYVNLKLGFAINDMWFFKRKYN